MGKLIMIMLTLICNIYSAFGQQEERFSAEIDANYYYYYISKNRKNNFNYGSSLLFAYCSGKLKYATGINYSTKNSYYNSEPNESNGFLEKREYELSYINIPVLITYGNTSTDRINFRFVGGFIFNRIVNYNITSEYLDGASKTEQNVQAGQKTGASIRLGVNISKLLQNNLCFNISPFSDFKFEQDHKDNYRTDYRQLTDDKLSFGVKIGIEYLF